MDDSHNILYGSVYGDGVGKFSIACKCCDLRFEEVIQLREHVAETISYPKLPELPTKCLEKIFRYISPNHLVNVSKASSKFKAIVEKIFALHFDPGPIEVQVDAIEKINEEEDVNLKPYNARCEFLCKSQYEIEFSSLIRRLIVPVMEVEENFEGYIRLAQFIRDNCSKELVSLCFWEYRATVPFKVVDFEQETYGEIIKDQLRHLQHLRVKDIPFLYLYDQLLQYTENLKSLTVVCELRRQYYDQTWTNQTYPQLESIHLHVADKFVDLMPMIERHSKLRNVATNSVATIKRILLSDIQFNYIGFVFWGDFTLLTLFHDDFVEFGRSKKFETLELCLLEGSNHSIDDEILKCIEKIPNITGLHGGGFVSKRGNIQLRQIEKLCIFWNNHKDSTGLIQGIDKQFPNLKKLRLNAQNSDWYVKRSEQVDFYKELARVILYDTEAFKNLQQLTYLNEKRLSFTWLDIVDMNFVRSKRANPTKLTIFIDPEHFHKFNSNVVELQFIEIKPWVHGECELCI